MISFAKRVKKITALEPSKGMIEKMRKNAQDEGIKNFDIINKTWQEVNTFEFVRKYDLVIYLIVLWIFKDGWEVVRADFQMLI